jgi:hypothetical protein
MLHKLPFDLVQLIASYLIEPVYELLDWIDPNKLDNGFLSSNINAMDFLEKHPHRIY